MGSVNLLAGLVIAGHYTLTWYVLVHPLADAGVRDLAMRVLGNADAALMLVLSYYFGASKEK